MKKFSMLVALLTLAACVDTENIEGNGRLVDVRRDVAAFHAVEASDGLRVEITVGPQNVALQLDDNIVDFVRVEVRGGVLVLEAKSHEMGFEPSSRSVIRVSSPTIDAVTLHDGARANAETASNAVVLAATDGAKLSVVARDARTVRADARDGSSIVLAGSALELEIEARDGSNVGSALPAESLVVSTHDGSGVRARASKSVRISASDGSNVDIVGNPTNRDVSSSDGSEVTFSN
jgi:hypothetical protein